MSCNSHSFRTRTDVPSCGRLPSKANDRNPPHKINDSNLNTELPPLVSPESPMTPDFDSLDVADLDSAQVCAQDLIPSAPSGTMTYPLPEAVDDTTATILDPSISPDTLDFTNSMHDFQDEDAFFAEFEAFTHTTSSQSLPAIQRTGDFEVQLSAGLTLHTPESQSHHANSKQIEYASSLPWVASWWGPELDELATLKSVDNSLTPETANSLLRDFFQYVNPTFPVVSEWDVYLLTHPEEIQAGERIPPMSLALFNAIMFAGCAVRLVSDQLVERPLTCPSSPQGKPLKQPAFPTFATCVKHFILEPRYCS